MRQFNICISNCCVTIQNRVNFVFFSNLLYTCSVMPAKSVSNSNICFVKNVKHIYCYTSLTGFGFLFSRFEDTDFIAGLGIHSFQKNVLIFAFFSILYKRTFRSLRSFPFFIKECSDLCVLFHSL